MHVMNNARVRLRRTGGISNEVGMYKGFLVNNDGTPVSRVLSVNIERDILYGSGIEKGLKCAKLMSNVATV